MPEGRAMTSRWWRGARGEWYVVIQIVLMALVFFGPSTSRQLPDWPTAVANGATLVGALLMLAGIGLLIAGAFRLRSNLTPLPAPRHDGTLIQTGAYGLVRHPMYTGGIGIAVGWALVVNGWLTLLYAIALIVFFELKSRREERWLVEKYPEYVDYQRRVPRLIPFIH
jgi:protein-S-isoprenylcysteine O-methyltransferase Ste14